MPRPMTNVILQSCQYQCTKFIKNMMSCVCTYSHMKICNVHFIYTFLELGPRHRLDFSEFGPNINLD